jgi:hypothetical protein
MANIVTSAEVFEFMKTQADVVTAEGTNITNLITRMQKELEEKIGRLIHSETITNILFQNGLNCEIYDEKLFLKGIYRDLYSITTISEEGTTLTAVTDYDDDNDYYLDTRKGCLIRNEQWWSTEPFAIKITGKIGMVNTSDDSGRNDWKQVLIEIVAAKSGLWEEIIVADGGEINRRRTTVSKDAKEFLEMFNLRGY